MYSSSNNTKKWALLALVVILCTLMVTLAVILSKDETPSSTAPQTVTPSTTTPDPTNPTSPDPTSPSTAPKTYPLTEEEKAVIDALVARAKTESALTLTDAEKALEERWTYVSGYIGDIVFDTTDDYVQKRLTADEAKNILVAFGNFLAIKNTVDAQIANIDEIEAGREKYEYALNCMVAGKYVDAYAALSQVSSKDTVYYPLSLEKISAISSEIGSSANDAITDYMVRYKLDEALALIEQMKISFPDATDWDAQQERVNEYKEFQTNLVTYNLLGNLYDPNSTKKIEHLFTHCLIAFPEICYSSPSMMQALDTDCITPYEFKKILENLYERDYILIDIRMLLNENGDLVSTLMLPEGKIPFIFSIDDVTYDSRKMGTGMIDKLILDETGRICTYTKHKNGEEVISYENEVFPILEAFVREHPDFVFQGARGMLCLTGFDGIFGYRTQVTPWGNEKNIDRNSEIEQAQKIANALKEEGWTFASHSYGHGWMSTFSLERLKRDLQQWEDEVASIVGKTEVFVWPFGDHGGGKLRKGELHKYMYDFGYKIFCGVGKDQYFANETDGLGIFTDRRMLTGEAFRLSNYVDAYRHLFDVEDVWDPLRPKTL